MPKDIKPRVTAAQSEVLCTFFEENPEVIKGYKKTSMAKEKVQNKWKKITPHLNSLGPSKEPNLWAKYLCNMKAKLKHKHIKWRQNSDGTGRIICNADDFDGIKLRMLQVLIQNRLDSPESLDSTTSDLDIEEDTKDGQDDDSNFEMIAFPSDDAKINLNPNPVYIKLRSNDTPPPETNVPQIYLDNERKIERNKSINESYDEFDTFGKNIAQQLRTLPLAVALETQEILLSVLRKQRLSVL